MRFSLSVLSSAALLLPILSAPISLADATTNLDLLAKAGVSFTGPAEFNPEAYQKLATLRKVFAGKTPTRTRKTRAVTRVKRLTNAERLRLKLPLNPPKRRDPTMQRRQEPSPEPFAPNVLGISLGVDLLGNNLGYVGASLSSSGQLQLGASVADALGLSISLGSSTKRGLAEELRIETKNAPADGLPLLALINGRDNENANLGKGSWHYLYVGTADYPGTEPNSRPSIDGYTSHEALTGMKEAFETDVWNLDTRTATISGTWINEDGAAVPVTLYEQAGVVLALADPEAFQAKYPAPIKPFTWKLVRDPKA
ncbi:hypothetical protein FA13DRAFT_179142 [Coprinellus micaceus]|uniref:Peptidase A1 domain-containing protein n=1 Tax=Coprinellus micaceus TaxID=71717 RepID=A0A4Y7TFS2_COPMI|nr:hypothetical protein FA13DRAFT_179142 [Coprinellus micaceus]